MAKNIMTNRNEYNGYRYYYNSLLRMWVISGSQYKKSFNTELELLEYIDSYGGEALPEYKDLHDWVCNFGQRNK